LSAPDSIARLAASAIRGVQCFIPVKTGRPSSSSSATRVCSVIAFQRVRVFDPEPAVARDEILEMLRPRSACRRGWSA